MILGLLQNACILVTFITILNQFLKDKNIFEAMSLRYKILFGVCTGTLGILLMLNSVYITEDTIIDFRYISVLMAAIYGGPLASVVSAFIIAIFRLLFLGISKTSVIVFIVAIMIGIGVGVIVTFKIEKTRKTIYSMIYLFIIMTISTFLIYRDMNVIIQTLTVFFIGYAVVSFISLKYADYVIETIRIYQKLKKEATRDYLTGLNNVREFDINFNSASQMTLRKEEDLSLLFIDIDFFKKVNDTYGHNAGDYVLKQLAQILVDTCRVYDIVSRNGGEEFSIILLDCTAAKATQIAERIRKIVAQYDFKISEKETIHVTVSIGVASYPEVTKDINHLTEDADQALYKAKRNGRNMVVLHSNV